MSRCLALKDKVVGHTDESGVTLPPLHPRCRCAIMYNEVEKIRIPTIIINNYDDVAKIRTAKEFMTLGEQIKPTIEHYAGRTSKWSGQIVLTDSGNKSGGKLWDCSVRLNPDAPEHVLIHELIHSCSVSHYGATMYAIHNWEEELTIHYLSQEIAKMKNIPVVESGYDEGVKLIREFKLVLGLKMSDLEFASELVKQPLGERWDWLAEKIYDTLGMNATMEQYQNFVDGLEAIRQWTAL